MKVLLLILSIFIASRSFAQPYIDLVKFNYSYSPHSGAAGKNTMLESHLFSANINLPIELKKGGDAFVINPFFDNNNGQIAGTDFRVQSQGLFSGFLKRNIFRNWDLLSAFVVRRNKETHRDMIDCWQYGGVLLTTWKKNQFASVKFGAYYNKEFFGTYFMPLVGIDWKINRSNHLFGVLPGNMTFEHQLSSSFYYGCSFGALTNSYRLQTIDACSTGDCSGKNYLRVDDNQLGGFADFYLTRKLVLSAESGHTILRKYRFGFKGDNLHLKSDHKTDNFYFRATVAYRLRLK